MNRNKGLSILFNSVNNLILQIHIQVIRRLLGKTDEDEKSGRTSASWVISFKQPASEYVKFRETLEGGFVALENVVLKNEICHMIGTIKVPLQFFLNFYFFSLVISLVILISKMQQLFNLVKEESKERRLFHHLSAKTIKTFN